MSRLCLLLCIASAMSGCSSSSGQCQTGTVRHGYACYPTDPEDRVPPVVTVDPPVRTYAVGTVRLTANEPATIYYTKDGTMPSAASASEQDVVVLTDVPDDATIAFYAVDLNGNASAVQTVHWQIDRNGPGTPRDFKLVAAGDMKTLSWTPPADPTLHGVLLARVEGPLTWSPERGHVYYPGNQLAPGIKAVAVIGAGLTGGFSESHATTPIGMARYAIWAFDDLYNYGSPANAYALDTLPTQAGAISVDAGTGAVTVTTPMPNITIAGTATLTTSELEIDLTLTNGTSRALFAPKVLVTNTLSVGSVDNNTDVLDTFPYYAAGGAIGAGKTQKVQLFVSGISNTDVVALNLELRNNPVFVNTAWSSSAGSAIDEVTNNVVLDYDPGFPGLSSDAGVHGGGVTIDGQVIAGARNSSRLMSFDLQTGARTYTTKLADGKQAASRVTLDPTGGTGYALVQPGHMYGTRQAGVPTQLVRFDAATLQVSGRLDIGISKNREISISPDGKYAAIATGLSGPIPVIDLDTFTVRTLDNTDETRSVVFAADGASLIASGSQFIRIIKTADWTVTKKITMPPPVEKSFHADFGPDGRLWVGRDATLAAIDLTTGVGESFDIQSAIMEVIGGKIWAADEGDSTIYPYDMTGTQSGNSLGFDDSSYGHWIGHTPF